MFKNNYIPNKIKQPGQCCTYCGKSYKLKTNLNKHTNLCELIYKSKGKRNSYLIIEEEDEIPSQKNMYKMLLEMAQKYSTLEEKMNEVNKWVNKKKKKINVLEWLNNNVTPLLLFENLAEKIIVTDEDINFLLNNTFYDTINELFNKTIYNINNVNNNENNTKYPIFALIQKSNTIYIYDKPIDSNNNNNNNVWQECTREKLVKFLNIVHIKISKYFYDWKKSKINENNNIDDNFATLCDKTLIKLMNIDFKQDAIFNKIKSQMYNKLKTDMKMLIEYEFEF
jgi:uncharacterized protein YcgL (UPF0745 family)